MAIFDRFEWFVARRYMHKREDRGFVSVIAVFSLSGIALGVMALIVVMSVMNGFRQELFDRILGLNGHMLIESRQGLFEDYKTLEHDVEATPGVVRAVPILDSDAMVTSDRLATGARIRGISKQELENLDLVSANMILGDLQAFDAPGQAIIGSRLAFRLGVDIGETFTVVSSQSNYTPFGSTPRTRTYEVAGIFRVGMVEYDSGVVFVPLSDAQLLLRAGDRVNGIEIFLTDPDQVGTVSEALRPMLSQLVVLRDWRQLNESIFNALQVERNVMFIILTLIILVAAFNVISSLIMLVRDKGRDIAIMRTMGANRPAVMRIFMILGSSIGILGTGVGLALGLIFCANIGAIEGAISSLLGTELFAEEIYFLSELPAEVDPWEVTGVVAISLFLSFVSTLYPSWWASRLDPVEALRYE